jgi:hypothetical protein
MIEAAVFLMQIASALVIVAGGVLTFSQVLESDTAARFNFADANDFEIDYRRVLGFARLAVHR